MYQGTNAAHVVFIIVVADIFDRIGRIESGRISVIMISVIMISVDEMAMSKERIQEQQTIAVRCLAEETARSMDPRA